MNTEKAHRDLGEAILEAYLNVRSIDDVTEIKVYAQRAGGNSGDVVIFVNGNIYPTSRWRQKELNEIAAAKRYIKGRKEEEEG